MNGERVIVQSNAFRYVGGKGVWKEVGKKVHKRCRMLQMGGGKFFVGEHALPDLQWWWGLRLYWGGSTLERRGGKKGGRNTSSRHPDALRFLKATRYRGILSDSYTFMGHRRRNECRKGRESWGEKPHHLRKRRDVPKGQRDRISYQGK